MRTSWDTLFSTALLARPIPDLWSLSCSTSRIPQSEANLFAANLLLDKEEIDSPAREGFDIVQIAHNLGTNVNLPLLKLQQINSDNHLHLPDMPSRNFLGTISDDAGHL